MFSFSSTGNIVAQSQWIHELAVVHLAAVKKPSCELDKKT